MKKEVILELFGKFEQACHTYNGIECWSAREVQEILGYSKWSNFLNVVEKAKKACKNADSGVSDHFADVGKMVLNYHFRAVTKMIKQYVHTSIP